MAIKRARIEIIPLIDVMFFLLAAFMMVSLSMQKAQTVKMELPLADTAQEDFKPDILNIGVEKDGNVSIGTNRVTLAFLGETLSAKYRSNTNTPVFLTGDRLATHGAINQVLDVVRRAGFQKISFVTSQGNGTASATTSPPEPPKAP